MDVLYDICCGFVFVDDKKSDCGFVEIYEEEYVKNSNLDIYVSVLDE